jgi:predicted CXXCH cytochrome family protein
MSAKRVFPCIGAVLAVALIFAANAGGSMNGTSHDLRTRLGIDEVCLPCHSPHSAANGEEGPLWNHALSEVTFVRKGEVLTLGRSSRLCMSCHDGVTAVGTYGSSTGSDPIQGASAIGGNLDANHPVGVDYPQGRSGYRDAGNPAVAAMLEENKVECGSCHYAHEGMDGKFLRATMNGSQLCLACHTY